jgi:hypothetical protein
MSNISEVMIFVRNKQYQEALAKIKEILKDENVSDEERRTLLGIAETIRSTLMGI